MCGSNAAAVASAMARTKLLPARAGSNACGVSAPSSCPSALCTTGQSAWARAVGSTPVLLRRTSSSPSVSRRRRSALLTAGCVSDSFSAARVRLRSAMTASKTRSRLRSRRR